jgi:circadian clock protein KaiC
MSSTVPKPRETRTAAKAITKCPTGIRGLDQIMLGGLPRGRTTLVCGNAGCGKTMLGMEFLVQGVTQYEEPGVCLSFEETADELTSNVSSLGFDLRDLIAKKKLMVDYVYIEPSEIEETGDYDLEALFVRLGHAVDSVGAKRVLLDGVEALFAGLSSEAILRSELRRLFRWLKDRKLTAIVTGERGNEGLTRHGIEEYISDCVILLDNRLTDAVSTRRLRVIKYRGSVHGTNEYPFLIDSDGISVMPVTSLELRHRASVEQVSTGVSALDAMFGGKGIYRGSSVLITGTAGSGKTSLLSHYVDAACARGERCVFFTFEESPDEVIRNMRSIGIDLSRWVKKGLLQLHASRPTSLGLELHLIRLHRIVATFKPSSVVIDPMSAMLHSGTESETSLMLVRMIDFFKEKGITAVMTSLTSDASSAEHTEVDISSLIDTWILLRNLESGGERNRGLFVLKARGISHSNQIREFLLTGRGVELREVYLGGAGLVTGSSRVAQEAKDVAEMVVARQRIEKLASSLERKRRLLDAQMASLRMQLESEEQEAKQLIEQEKLRLNVLERDRDDIAVNRAMKPRTAKEEMPTDRKTGKRAQVAK